MTMNGWRIAVLGATGAVGRALLDLLQEREFPISETYLLASENSAGETIRFNGKSLLVNLATEFDWSKVDIAFFVASEAASREYAERAADAGCLVIDTSHAFALEPDVPLVVPTVNEHVLADYRNRNIIAIADSLVSQLLIAITPLIEEGNQIQHLHVTNFISASKLGKEAVNELAGQSARLLNGLPLEKDIFQKQLAFNILPDLANGEQTTPNELTLVMQIRKIYQDFYLPISSSCVQSPVFYGNAQLVHLGLAAPSLVENAKQALQASTQIVLHETDYPTQIDVLESELAVHVGCISQDYGMPELLRFWSVTDNVRYGGALMAVLVAERLMKDYL